MFKKKEPPQINVIVHAINDLLKWAILARYSFASACSDMLKHNIINIIIII